jgi:GH24 family phage-related lysozyme (muramidase)
VHPGQVIDQTQAEESLAGDIEQVERGLNGVFHVPLTQGEYDALVSLCFNLKGGGQRLAEIAPRLVAKLNSEDRAGAALELLDINRANGRILSGLTRRREAERALFLS